MYEKLSKENNLTRNMLFEHIKRPLSHDFYEDMSITATSPLITTPTDATMSRILALQLLIEFLIVPHLSGVLIDIAQSLNFEVPWMLPKGRVRCLEDERGYSNM
jgi:hypothetical protein